MSTKKYKYLLENYDKNDTTNENSLEDIVEDDLIDLEEELNYKVQTTLPKNYGNIWIDNDRKIIIELLQKSNIIENFHDHSIISKIANKISRSEGGVRSEIKKIIFNKYINGKEINEISNELNISENDIKYIIKVYLQNDSDKYIKLLEKENKILNLKIENLKLRKELSKLVT